MRCLQVKNQLDISFADFLLSWDGYAISAAALGQMLYPSALMHKRVVAHIAKTEGERVAVVYDVLVRCVPSAACAPCLPFALVAGLLAGRNGKMIPASLAKSFASMLL